MALLGGLFERLYGGVRLLGQAVRPENVALGSRLLRGRIRRRLTRPRLLGNRPPLLYRRPDFSAQMTPGGKRLLGASERISRGVGRTAVEIGRGSVRLPLAGLISLPGAQRRDVFTPKTRLERTLLGGEPVRSVQAGTVSQGLQRRGVDPRTANLIGAGALAAGIVTNITAPGKGKLAKSVGERIIKKPSVLGEIVQQVVSTPRTLMATADVSAPFRQGLLLLSHPRRFFGNFAPMFRSLVSEKAYRATQAEIVQRPTYELMRRHRLAITDLDVPVLAREEAIASSWLEKIPVAGSVIRGSNRAYTTFLNRMRADVFDDLITKANRIGLNPQQNEHLVDSVARFINSASGRASLGSMEGAASALNATFFAPRLVKARLDMLNPAFYASLDPFARKEALKSVFTLLGTGLTALGLAKLGGATVELDPRSSDFMKARIGKVRLDPWGGFQQYSRYGYQLITGRGKALSSGNIYTKNRLETLGDLAESKLNPSVGFILNLMRGKTFLGEDVTLKQEAIDKLTPIVWGDIYDLYKEDPKLIPLGLSALFGVGIQIHKDRPQQPKKKSPKKRLLLGD